MATERSGRAGRPRTSSDTIRLSGMGARTLDGNAVRDDVLDELASQVAAAGGTPPGLAAVLVGQDPASRIYVRNKIRACDRIGLHSETHRMPEESTTEELVELVESLNRDEAIDGILIQLPLPRHVDADRVLSCVDPRKDVDGFHPVNVGRLARGEECLKPCTPRGLIEILRRHSIPIEGRRAVIVGRSNIVGKPVAFLLLAEHATVTICHSRTRRLAAVCRSADILVAAAGRPAMLTRDFIREGAVVLDVGINRLRDESEASRILAHDPKRLERFRRTGKVIVGDVHPGHVREVASAYTPVPGGVGPLTIAMLMSNTLEAARRRRPAIASSSAPA